MDQTDGVCCGRYRIVDGAPVIRTVGKNANLQFIVCDHYKTGSISKERDWLWTYRQHVKVWEHLHPGLPVPKTLAEEVSLWRLSSLTRQVLATFDEVSYTTATRQPQKPDVGELCHREAEQLFDDSLTFPTESSDITVFGVTGTGRNKTFVMAEGISGFAIRVAEFPTHKSRDLIEKAYAAGLWGLFLRDWMLRNGAEEAVAAFDFMQTATA